MKYEYEQIAESEIPATVRWDVPPQNQGQIIEVAYSDARPGRYEACRGSRYQRVTDASDRRVTYYRLVRTR